MELLSVLLELVPSNTIGYGLAALELQLQRLALGLELEKLEKAHLMQWQDNQNQLMI